MHVIIPDAFVAALPPFTRTGTYVEAGGEHTYALPRFYLVQGANLTDEANEALPTAPDDPRVYDQDGDGKPGMTLRATLLCSTSPTMATRRSWSPSKPPSASPRA